MLHKFKLTQLSQLALVAAVVILSIFHTQPSNAQTTTFGPPTTVMCNETQSIAIDPAKFAGTWYEQARNPALNTPFGCVQVNFTVDAGNNTMKIATTYTDTPLYPWVNQTMTATVAIASASDDASTSGYNFSYLLPQNTYTPYALYKILDVDYDNYTFICGYTNQTDNSTSFGIVLTRVQLFNFSELPDLGYQGFPNFPNNDDWFMSQITQSETCYASGAKLSTVPTMFGMFFAIFYTALNRIA